MDVEKHVDMGWRDPVNEIVFFRFQEQWNAIGPLSSLRARRFLRLFKEIPIPAFACLNSEYIEKGNPVHTDAREYFDTITPEWLHCDMNN